MASARCPFRFDSPTSPSSRGTTCTHMCSSRCAPNRHALQHTELTPAPLPSAFIPRAAPSPSVDGRGRPPHAIRRALRSRVHVGRWAPWLRPVEPVHGHGDVALHWQRVAMPATLLLRMADVRPPTVPATGHQPRPAVAFTGRGGPPLLRPARCRRGLVLSRSRKRDLVRPREDTRDGRPWVGDTAARQQPHVLRGWGVLHALGRGGKARGL